MTASAPAVNKLRTSLPPLELCLGTSPIQAEKSLPDRNAFGSATLDSRFQFRRHPRAAELLAFVRHGEQNTNNRSGDPSSHYILRVSRYLREGLKSSVVRFLGPIDRQIFATSFE